MNITINTRVVLRSGDAIDELTLWNFIEDNADGLTLQDIGNIGATLGRGEQWHGGDGAAGVYTLTLSTAQGSLAAETSPALAAGPFHWCDKTYATKVEVCEAIEESLAEFLCCAEGGSVDGPDDSSYCVEIRVKLVDNEDEAGGAE